MFELCLALSLHIGLGDGWNQTHPCVRYVDGPWTVGAFLNSENNVSAYASYTLANGPWFVEAGVVTGYSAMDIAPMVRVGVHLGDNMRLFAAPGILMPQKDIGAVLGLEFSIPIRASVAPTSH